MSALEQFPILMAALKEELKRELLEELAQGQWLDQGQSVLGRNIHVLACRRLISRDSPDAYYDATDGRWLLRGCAVDREIQRRNRMRAATFTEPAAKPEAITPPPLLLAKAGPVSADDTTGVYERALLERVGLQ